MQSSNSTGTREKRQATLLAQPQQPLSFAQSLSQPNSMPMQAVHASQMAMDISTAMALERACTAVEAGPKPGPEPGPEPGSTSPRYRPTSPCPEPAASAGAVQAVPVSRSPSPRYRPISPYFLPMPPQARCEGVRATAKTFSLTLRSFMESYAGCMNVRPQDVFDEERLCREIEVLRGTKDDPKHRVELAAYGVATGKWSEKNKHKAVEAIKEALDFKNSGECDGSQCKNDQTGKHMLCNIDTKVVKTRHPVNGSVIQRVYTPIDDTTTWSCHNIPAIKALGTKAFRSVTGADGAAAQLAIGTSAVMTAVNPGRSVVAALGRANDERPPQVEHTQTEETIENEDGATTLRKTQETQVRTDEGASVTLRRGVEEGNNADGTPFLRLGQDMRVQNNEGASMQTTQMIVMNGEVVSLLRGMRDDAIVERRNQVELLNCLMQRQQKDKTDINNQLQKIHEEQKQLVQRINALEGSQQQSAGAPNSAQGGPAPPAGQLSPSNAQGGPASPAGQSAKVSPVLKSHLAQRVGQLSQSNAQGGPVLALGPVCQPVRKRGRPPKNRGRPPKNRGLLSNERGLSLNSGPSFNSTEGAASNAKAGPAPEPDTESDLDDHTPLHPRKRGRSRLGPSDEGASAGAASKKAPVAKTAKRAQRPRVDPTEQGLAAENLEFYPEEEKIKDAAESLLFDKWNTHLGWSKRRGWHVYFTDKSMTQSQTNYKIKSPYVDSLREVCYLRRQLCLSSRNRDENAKKSWDRLKTCPIPTQLYNNAVISFERANRTPILP